ncbi:uncharacterized protein LOC131073766 isoform X2 [Cryptomeria japonica]|uniref:uncharacterized protein LOC131073766 isoform X2 n=1 Tax=Cryptomeria japonica TaxID=3369 RepID=UPI0027DA37F0|nr:uncharacterized protein LOC131073766 isoform X2 [Cryptomeria japonica]
MPTKLKFKIINLLDAMPNGYRLATVEEVKINLDTLKHRALFENYKFNERGFRLLDGGLLLPDYRLEHVFDRFYWSVVVKEKEREEDAGVWKKKGSACYPSTADLLRKQVYDGIILSPQGRHTAMASASINCDAEVIYWLLKTTNQIELQGFTNFLKSKKMKDHTYYSRQGVEFSENLFESLSASEFPLQLPLEHDHFMNHFLANDIFKSFYNPIVYVELLVEMYSTNIVHYKGRDGVSLLDQVTQKAINNKYEDWIPTLTKLLSVSQHSVENQVSEIKHRFGDIFIEAIERGHAQLVEDLLKLKDDYIEQLTTAVCMKVAAGIVCKGYLQCLPDLLNLLKQKVGNELPQDKHGKTLFHYAADSQNEKVFPLLAETYQDMYTERKRDKWGRNILHWAALNGQADFCKVCVDDFQLKVDAKDSFGRNSLHLAAQGKKGHLVVGYLVESSSVNLIYVRDDEGRTPLHLASAKGNIEMVEKLLSFSADNPSQGIHYIKQVDGLGKTALQMAAGGGHTRIVRLLLDRGCDPLSERDVNGSTALHYAVKVKDAEVALAMSQSLLNKYEIESKKKSLLLWASAGGIGTADESEWVDPSVKDFFLQAKARDDTNLLKAAAETKNAEMTWELLNRGARMADLDHYREREDDGDEQIRNAKLVIREIDIAKEHGRDKPSLKDNLERNVLAEGLAALFLNKFIESPITVGISGEWGMGKSSLMIQIESILLIAASQLSFPNLLRSEKFAGAEKISLSTKGRKIYTRMKIAMNKLFSYSEYHDLSYDEHPFRPFPLRLLRRAIFLGINKIYKLLTSSKSERGLVKLLEEYHPQRHGIYKSLACMDIHNQMLSSHNNGESEFQQMRGVPRVLTIRYNAWHYRDEHEAWAGLAVTITKEIEKAITRAQWFSTCWRYSWAKNSVNICIQIFLPCLLVTFLAGWVAWAAWALLRNAKFKELQYGSIPCTIIAIVWVVLKSVISVVKPVSTQMMGYINSPDHTVHLGYQEQVISDIHFLKGELGRKPHWFFSFISGEWCRNWFGLYPDNVENTCIPKFRPASEGQLRIITFVDDLDRCDEKVVLQVLSAINLVLAECKINVILGIDKKMIQRAVERHFKDNNDKDLADKFICKIIQIPLSLPDPTEKESDKFLQYYLGHQPPLKTTLGMEDNEDTDYGDIDTDNDDENTQNEGVREENAMVNIDCSNGLSTSCQDDENTQNEGVREENAVVNIDCSNGLSTSCQGLIKKVCHWSTCLFQILCLLACNLSSELRQMDDELNTEGIHSLRFSKGVCLTREMLLSNYSLEEATTLYDLKRFAIGTQKLPREWKRFLDYRKFVCNVLSMRGKVYRLLNWKLELVAWIFICWNWKHEMNTLIKGWHKYTIISSKGGDEVEHVYGPSLRQIVMNYVIELPELQSFLDIDADLVRDGELNSRTTEAHRIEEIQTKYFNWFNLLKALKIQDVSMRGIQLFQQFRLHCETDNLPWPLLESHYSQEEVDTLDEIKMFATSRQKNSH